MRILYDSKNLKYKSPFGCLKENEPCTMHIDIPSSCKAHEVKLVLKNEHTGEFCEELFSFEKTQGDYDVFACEFSIDAPGLYFYKFHIRTFDGEFELFKEGISDTNIAFGDMWQLSVYSKDFTVPESFQGRVMYQIFPDRFYAEGECCLSSKLKPFYIHENKNDTPDFMPNELGKVMNCDFFGGNLKGIEKKLDYIKELGVSVIYLNPIFKAFSNHRYDTCDYKTIDPMLGNEEDFVSLCNEAHKKGIRIILDGVFSHTGSNSIYFDAEHIFGNGAVSNEASPYREWYNFEHYPDKYDAWWGIETLPAVNELNDGYLDYIIQGSDSVIAHWLNLGADGFRLDVADELPDRFIYLLRKRVKEIKSESYVVGEVWEDASNKISYSVRRKYFVGSELDSVMNYVYKNAIIDFVCGVRDCKSFANEVMTLAENYPSMCLNSLMNSLSTHDTARILTCLSGCSFPSTKEAQAELKLSSKEINLGISRLYTAAFLQYTLPGTPCIYYGDEIGMTGFGDPFCRGYFKWDDMNLQLLNLFKELGKIKNKYKALQMGDIKIITSDTALVFKRTYKNQSLTCTVNMSDEAYEVDNKNIIISHLTSTVGEKAYISKGGYVMILSSSSPF